MVSKLHFYTHAELGELLPMKTRMDLQTEVFDKEIQLRDEANLKSMKLTKNWFPIPTVAGVAMAVAGVFLVLAAHQILPRGINAISQLGPYGKIGGYALLAVGSLTTLASAPPSLFVYRRNAKIHSIEKKVMAFQAEKERQAVEDIFKKVLKPNEYLVIDDPSKSLLTICQAEENPSAGKKGKNVKAKQSYTSISTVTYPKSSPEKGLQTWTETHKQFAEKATPIRIKTLKERVRAFERAQIGISSG